MTLANCFTKRQKALPVAFIMAGANCPIVRRSSGLLNYQDGLVYSQAMALSSLKSAVQNFAVLGIGTPCSNWACSTFCGQEAWCPQPARGPPSSKRGGRPTNT